MPLGEAVGTVHGVCVDEEEEERERMRGCESMLFIVR